MSSSHVAFLSELGAADRIVGISGTGFVTDPTIRERCRAGDIAEVGWDSNIDVERIVALRPDVVLMSFPEERARLEEMGLRCFPVEDWTETTPLGRAGWIVPIAELCGLGDVGAARLAEITLGYNETALQARELASRSGARPRVMLNAPYRDVWWVPADDNFMVQLVRDAGGEWIFEGHRGGPATGGSRGSGASNNSGAESYPVDIEEAWLAMQSADVWLNTGHYDSLAALLADNPRFADAPPVVAGQVFNNTARTTPEGGSDFWESGVVRPDRVLRDLVAILHGSDPAVSPDPSPDTLYYYKRLR